jgi:lysophospholipase L1-like esterase
MNWTELFTSWEKLYNADEVDLSYYDIDIQNKDTLIVCLGDSWTWGDSLGESRTQQFYARHLANHYDADFINVGFRGYSNSWTLYIGEKLLKEVKKLNYHRVIVAITLTENARDFKSAFAFRFDFAKHFVTHGISDESYESVLTNTQHFWQKQIIRMIAQSDDRFKFFVGQNFVWHDFYNTLEHDSLVTTNINWIELLADYQNMPRPIRTNMVTGFVFGQINLINQLADIKDTAVYKKWIIPYIDRAQLVNQWLDSSPLNNKKASKHPTALGHELWAKHIIESLERHIQ